MAFSDIHCDSEVAKDIVEASSAADVVIGAGDFATSGLGASDTLDILREISVPTIIVSGNHDNLDELRRFCKVQENCHLLHGTSITIEGRDFFGLGGEVPRSSEAEWNHYLSEEDAEKLLAACPKHAILVTHSPPWGHCDLQRDGSHEGSQAIRDILRMQQPVIHLCGHIHHSWGTTSAVAECPIYNLGPSINWFDIED